MRRGTAVRILNRKLEVLPGLGDEVSTVTSLQLAGNNFGSLPELVRAMPNLVDLGLASNRVACLQPTILAELGQLRALSLSGNMLTTLPAEIGLLAALETLALGGNQLHALPPQLGDCLALRTLTLSENHLTTLPTELGRLRALRTLRIDCNRDLRVLPDELCALAELTALSVAGCCLEALPAALGMLTSLTMLQAKDNELTTLPASVGSLKQLRVLGASGNRIQHLPDDVCQCGALRVLALSANRLARLPALDALCALEELRLDDNPLTALPELPLSVRVLGLSVCSNIRSLPVTLGELSELTQLSMGACRVQQLPGTTCELKRLATLQLSGNQLTTLPAELGRLHATLTALEVSDNRLSEVPTSLGQLANLISLRAAENAIGQLPEDIGRLGHLEVLNVAANRLTALPSTMGSLSSLRVLEVASNRLTRFPATLCELPHLRTLLLDDNELEEIPESLADLTSCEELGLAFNKLASLPLGLLDGRMRSLRVLRVHSNELTCANMDLDGTRALREPILLFDNPRSSPVACVQGRPHGPGADTEIAGTGAQSGCSAAHEVLSARPIIALLLPGLVRNYAHGSHWVRFVKALSSAYDVRIFLCVWSIRGAVANNFAQGADRVASEQIDLDELQAWYPVAEAVEVVGLEHWLDKDAQGNDGRYVNQWNMVARCWALMERSLALVPSSGRPQFVIRARPDLRVACLPVEIVREPPYLAMQERLWGSDCFFYGDYESMQAVCAELAPKYDELTMRLGQASSEPMLHQHLVDAGLTEGRLIRFARCCSVDRS